MAVALREVNEQDIANNIIDQILGTPSEKEKEKFVIDDDVKADWAVEKIKALDQSFENFKGVVERKIEQLKLTLAVEERSYRGERNVFLNMLRAYFDSLEGKEETETLIKHKLPSGVLRLKKEKKDFDPDKDKLLVYAKEKGLTEFIKSEVLEEFKWGEFKDRLKITDSGTIVDKKTGEALAIEGLDIKTIPASFEVKYK